MKNYNYNIYNIDGSEYTEEVCVFLINKIKEDVSNNELDSALLKEMLLNQYIIMLNENKDILPPSIITEKDNFFVENKEDIIFTSYDIMVSQILFFGTVAYICIYLIQWFITYQNNELLIIKK